jgi:glycosyltransferase involved in cell wall biosynthesis
MLPESNKNNIEISIVIPVYEDPNGILATLNALEEQTYPDQNYEILVVDNNSNDETPEVINRFKKRAPHLVRLYNETKQSSYAARNKGIEHAKGDIIAFLDADEVVASDWLEKIDKKLANSSIRYLGCNVEVICPKDRFLGQFNQETGFHIQKKIEDYHFAATCSLVVRADIFRELGLFDDDLISRGDVEFGRRAFRHGINLEYADDICVYHPARTTFESLCKKEFRCGRGRYQYQKKYNYEENEDFKLKSSSFWKPFKFLLHSLDTSPKRSDNQSDRSVTKKLKFYVLEGIFFSVSKLGFYYQK